MIQTKRTGPRWEGTGSGNTSADRVPRATDTNGWTHYRRRDVRLGGHVFILIVNILHAFDSDPDAPAEPPTTKSLARWARISRRRAAQYQVRARRHLDTATERWRRGARTWPAWYAQPRRRRGARW